MNSKVTGDSGGFFEKHLIDYDVGSNYGNWQYIAGVGSDPRGGRHFNLGKQTAEHDPNGIFVAKWGGVRPLQPDYITDAADWPIDSEKSDLPTKVCPVCDRPFAWRAKWKLNWDSVVYCSNVARAVVIR